MALGKGKPEEVKYNGEVIQWVNNMKITGVTFGNDGAKNMIEDFKTPLNKAEAKFDIWRCRGLSLIGRVQILKTFGSTQFQYLTNMI